MRELRAVKILLVPTKEQRQAFYDSAYYSDRMYNEALQWNKDYYDEEGKFYSRFDMIRMIPSFRKKNPEFCKVDSYILKSAVTDLRYAFNHMKSGARFPRFKRYGRKNSFGVRNDNLKVYSNKVRIPSIGFVKCKHCHWLTRGKSDDYLLNLKYSNPHIKFDGKYWFLTFGLDVNIIPDKTTEEIVGIDIGIKNTISTSNGIVEPNINNERAIIKLERRKKIFQRKIAKKYQKNKQGNKYIKTNSIKKLERKVRVIDRRLHNIREDNLNRITNKVISQYPKRIIIEDLQVKNMMKNRHLSKAIQDQQFYHIRQLLIEKALNTNSVQIGVVDKYYPSSKKCSRCGNIKNDLKLSDRVYKCDRCGLTIDRDFNASLNLRNAVDYKVVAN